MKGEGFPESIRIKKKKEWKEVIQKGEKVFSPSLLLLRLKTDEQKFKFGVGIISGIKGGIKRNRIKRILREVLRRNKNKFFPGENVLLLYRTKNIDLSYDDVSEEFLNLMEKAKYTNA